MSLDYRPKDIAADLISNNWSLQENPNVNVEDNKDKKVRSTKQPVEIRVRQLDPVIEQADVLYQTEDITIPVMIQIHSHKDQAVEYWKEVRRILGNNRTDGRGLPGGWQKIEFDDNELTDPSYAEHTAMIQVDFVRYNNPF